MTDLIYKQENLEGKIKFKLKRKLNYLNLSNLRRTLITIAYKSLFKYFSMKCYLCEEVSLQYDYCHNCGYLSCSNCYQKQHRLFEEKVCRYKYNLVFIIVQLLFVTFFLKIQVLFSTIFNYYFIMFFVFFGINSYIIVYISRKILNIRSNINTDRITISMITHSLSFILCFLKDSKHLIISESLNLSFLFWLKIVVLINLLTWSIIISYKEKRLYYKLI